MKLLLILWFVFSAGSFAQERSNQLKGSYVLGTTAKVPVEFTLNWTEENGSISGKYQDNNFAQFARVSGTSESNGRQFKVVLPEPVKGAATISILTSNIKARDTGIQVPAVIIFRDLNGNPIAIRETHAIYTAKGGKFPVSGTVAQREIQKEEERRDGGSRTCMERMGELAGFCGTYKGLISEEADASNSCNLLLADEIGLGIDSERNLRLYLSSSDPMLNPPTHILRRLPPGPNRRIDVTIRSCGSLPAVAFATNPQSCKKLNLSGTFFNIRRRKAFTGTYTIFDEKTRHFCRYGLSLEKD